MPSRKRIKDMEQPVHLTYARKKQMVRRMAPRRDRGEYHIVSTANGPTPVYTPGYLARYVGIGGVALANWIDRGVLPPPTFVCQKGRHWYSEAYCAFIREVYDQNTGEGNLCWLADRFRREWVLRTGNGEVIL